MSRIIRAERRGPALIRSGVYAAQRDAAVLLSAAREDAARITAQAEAEAARLRERAEAQGHAEGVARAARALFDVAALRTSTLHETEREARQAVLLLASKLTQQTLELEPTALRALVAPLFARIRRARHITLRVHPDDVSALAELPARADLAGVLAVLPDPTISRGGCLIQSDLGQLDARLETRVGELAKALGWEPP
jgi:flagellar biosynthesis/type III secretory pathway protein FliH